MTKPEFENHPAVVAFDKLSVAALALADSMLRVKVLYKDGSTVRLEFPSSKAADKFEQAFTATLP